MIRVHATKSSSQAKAYFTDSLDRGDYYSEGQELAGRWGGKLASRFRLQGQVAKNDFFSLCDNLHPGSGEKLTPRNGAKRRVGYDIVFDVPKSVTLLWALGNDQRVLRAFQDTVRQTMAEFEELMKTRVRVDGKDSDRVTGNALWAEFTHTTARPVKGISDPHLHAHCFTFNVTWDAVEDRFKAGEFEAIKRSAPHLEARFDCRMAAKLRLLGYEICQEGKYWDVVGIPKELSKTFSRRTSRIEAAAKRRGIEDPDEKAKLGATTRERKDKGKSLSELKDVWRQMAGEKGMAAIKETREKASAKERSEEQSRDYEEEKSKRDAPKTFGKGELKEASRAVSLAIEDVFQRQAAARLDVIKDRAMRFGTGVVTPEAIDKAIENSGLTLRQYKEETWATTKENRKAELELIRFAEEGKKAFEPIARRGYDAKDKELTPEQLGALAHVLTSPSQVMTVLGGAGTGKTRLAKEVVRATSSMNAPLLMLTQSVAGRDSLLQDGFKNVATVAQYLGDERLRERYRQSLLWVDDGGKLGTKDALELFKAGDKCDCRFVLSGNVKQRNRGDAVKVLVEEAGIHAAEILAVRRQRGEFKEACEHFEKGEYGKGLGLLAEMNNVYEAKGKDGWKTVHERLAYEYVDSLRGKHSVLAISRSRKDKELVNKAVRWAMRGANMVKDEGKEVKHLLPLHLSNAEKRLKESYAAGMAVRFHGSSRGGKPGMTASVVGVKAGVVWVSGALGSLTPFALNLKDGHAFSVYEEKAITLAPGDRIRITENGKAIGDVLGFLPDRQNPLRSKKQFKEEIKRGLGLPEHEEWVHSQRHTWKRLNKGAEYEVKRLLPGGAVLLSNGLIMDKSFKHFEYAYCSSIEDAQTKTVDKVLLSDTVKSGKESFDNEQLRQAVTRATDNCIVFTDDKERLFKDREEGQERLPTATQIVREGRDLEWEREQEERMMREYAERERAEEEERERQREKERAYERG